MHNVRQYPICLLALMLLACSGEEKIKPVSKPPLAENQPPVAAASGPAEVLVGATVTLDASASADPDAEPLTFLWMEDEGNPVSNALDGVELTEDKLVFTATDEGTFTYQVRVRDAALAEDTAQVTVKVTRNTVKPTLTAIRVSADQNFATFTEFAPGAAPAVFTTSTGILYIQPLGADEDSDASTLTAQFSDNAPEGTVIVAAHFEASKDDDGFGVIPVEVWVKDTDGLTSDKQSLEVRVVPRATSALLPKAFFVDCGAIGGLGTMPDPFGTIQAGYAAAVTNGSDVYVAVGTCEEDTIQVDFDGIALYGMFLPEENWRRRTEPSDKAVDLLAGAGHKFAERTTVKNPVVDVLFQGPKASAGSSSLSVNGFSFELSGRNIYAIALTSPAGSAASRTFARLSLINNEFTGAVTTFTTGGLAGGGISIKAGADSGVFTFLRNFFSVDAADGQSKFQLHMANPGMVESAGSTTHFHSNVFYGTIGKSPGGSYSCSSAPNPFAFCFFQWKTATNTGVVKAYRNHFHVSNAATDANIEPIVLDPGRGRFEAIGNAFYNGNSAANLTIIRTDGGAGSSSFIGNAFPAPADKQTYVFDDRTGPASDKKYKCVTGSEFGTTTTSCAGPSANFNADGSIAYSNVTLGDPQPWRFYSDEFADLMGDMPAISPFDFDGRHGAIDENGITAPADYDYNAGAFEPGAPLY